MRVVIVEDSLLLREGLTRLLEEGGFEVVAAVENADGVVDLVEDRAPDVVITDIKMPPTHGEEGLQLAEEIKERFPKTGVLVLSQYVEARYAMGLMRVGGGVGYILKDRVAAVGNLLSAVMRVGRGESVVDPEVVSQLMSRRGRDKLTTLTQREKQILALMAQGMSNQGIRDTLYISKKTLETHIGRIFTKLELQAESEGHRRVLAVLTYLRT